ncbi:MAG: protein phosphatase CheZ [Proteobacteria bacterium]|nr:protein phosphatase CheZ [Pseudomonadota bacterium]
MTSGNAQHFETLIGFLKEKRENVTFGDIIRLAEISAESLQGFFRSMDWTVYRELREIAGYIETMKKEMGALRANELKENRIPAAGLELSAIVQATETASNTIMECAEALMAANAKDPAAYKALVEEKMLVIFEACSFQDLTGQRIAKVVETLQHIEERVARFASVMQAKDLDGFMSDTERSRDERRQRLLLNGPQLAGHGIDQSSVDTLLAGSGGKTQAAKSPQDEVDALFP